MKNDGITPPGNGCPVEWISRNTQQALREIAGSLQQRRHVGNSRNSFARTRAFVVGKEERPILADWTTEREAKLVADILWRRFIAGREEVARIEGGVAMKFVKRTVKVVGAGLEHHVDLRTRIATERRVVGAGQRFQIRVSHRPEGARRRC